MHSSFLEAQTRSVCSGYIEIRMSIWNMLKIIGVEQQNKGDEFYKMENRRQRNTDH